MENNKQQIVDDFSETDKVISDLKLWDYKNPDKKVLIGIVIEIEPEGTYGRSVIVDTIEETNLTIPSLTALNTKLRDVRVGDKIKLECLGLIRGKNKRDYYDFNVFIKENSNQ